MQYAEAVKALAEVAKLARLKTEVVSISNAFGRRASKDHTSTLTIPPYDNSGVDGYCFSSSSTANATAVDPVHFKIAGTLFPGDLPPDITPKGAAWEIMTGAPFPKDCDCSVKVEDTPAFKDEKGHVISISVSAPVAPGDFIREAGADFSLGLKIVSRGEKVRAEHLMALAANGVTEIEVYRKPRVVLVPTGSELAEVGTPLKPGQIYNSTQAYLIAALTALDCDVEAKATIKDDPQAFATLLGTLKKSPPDILMTTGAVSMGKSDFVRPGLEAAGAEVIFHRVEIRPGKPILFANFGKESGAATPFIAFGLPGNPVSSVIGTRFFIEPYLRKLMGVEEEKPMLARLQNEYRKPEALRCFLKAKFELNDLVPTATIFSGQPSFMIRPLLHASAWAVVGEGVREVNSGDLVTIYPQSSDF